MCADIQNAVYCISATEQTGIVEIVSGMRMRISEFSSHLHALKLKSTNNGVCLMLMGSCSERKSAKCVGKINNIYLVDSISRIQFLVFFPIDAAAEKIHHFKLVEFESGFIAH